MSELETEPLTREQIEAQLLGKAAHDESFRTALIETPQAIWDREFGQTLLSSLKLKVLQNSLNTLYLIAPTQDETLRKELSNNPKAVWKRRFGTTKLQGYTIRVIEEQPGEFCFVMPTSIDLEAEAQFLEEAAQQGFNLEEHTAKARKELRSLTQRKVPKTKLGRILLRLEGFVLVWIKSNPIVVSILRPIYWVRSLIFAWRRL
ncbi:hypothetical protein ACQ4M3_27540 [Leptolyngbya sp. AN03gr2]|uniref:hypothetical protein n=1 Tax=unclassified Leptolyngbya TaxID=2650499 RepID=UPI003D31D909